MWCVNLFSIPVMSAISLVWVEFLIAYRWNTKLLSVEYFSMISCALEVLEWRFDVVSFSRFIWINIVKTYLDILLRRCAISTYANPCNNRKWISLLLVLVLAVKFCGFSTFSNSSWVRDNFLFSLSLLCYSIKDLF
jgi:hypothetical protein